MYANNEQTHVRTICGSKIKGTIWEPTKMGKGPAKAEEFQGEDCSVRQRGSPNSLASHSVEARIIGPL
jgi:hypothetical protein